MVEEGQNLIKAPRNRILDFYVGSMTSEPSKGRSLLARLNQKGVVVTKNAAVALTVDALQTPLEMTSVRVAIFKLADLGPDLLEKYYKPYNIQTKMPWEDLIMFIKSKGFEPCNERTAAELAYVLPDTEILGRGQGFTVVSPAIMVPGQGQCVFEINRFYEEGGNGIELHAFPVKNDHPIVSYIMCLVPNKSNITPH